MKRIIKIVAVATLLFGTSAVFTACNNEDELSQNQQGRYWKQESEEQIVKKVAESGWYHIFIEKRDANGIANIL